ncbi:MAG: hypothetical protein AAGI66_04345 [Cyanobacteria bacterium P01_H01_bin.74]
MSISTINSDYKPSTPEKVEPRKQDEPKGLEANKQDSSLYWGEKNLITG